MAPPRLVTLSSDIGPVYSAQMKGVLSTLLPAGRIVELTHDLPPHGVLEASFLLRQMLAPFPPGSVHVAVVDPGVGGPRAPIAVRCANGSILIGPDNGLLIPTADRFGGGRAYRLDPAHLPGPVSPTFEGRDLFAPVAGRVASGVPVATLGSPWEPRPSLLHDPVRRGGALAGTVASVDRFGNIITTLPSEWLPVGGVARGATVGRLRFPRLPRVRTYSDLEPGQAGILGSSFGTLEISVREAPVPGSPSLRAGAPVRIGPAARTRSQ